MNIESRKTLHARLPEQVRRTAHVRCAELGVSLSNYIEWLIEMDIRRVRDDSETARHEQQGGQ